MTTKLQETISSKQLSNVAVTGSSGTIVGDNNTQFNFSGDSNNNQFAGANLTGANFSEASFTNNSMSNNSQNTYAPQLTMTNTGSGIQNTGQLQTGRDSITGHQTLDKN